MEVKDQKSLNITAASSSLDNQNNDQIVIEPSTPMTKFSLKNITSSNLQASLTLFKSFIGTGILALPYAFKTAGVTLSIIMTVIIGTMLSHCFVLLLKTADATVGNKKVSFPKLAWLILGNKGKYIAQTLLIIEQLGCCVGIIMFSKGFLNHILCSFEVEGLCDNTIFNLLFAVTLTVPLCLINNMHYFYIPSLAANFFIMIGLISQMFFNVESVRENPVIRSEFASNFFGFHITKLPIFFGVALFSFEGVGLTFSIRDSMEKPEDLSKILKSQMKVITFIYIVFSAVSCLALGDKLEDIVFFSLPTDQPFYLLIQILYAISALFTFPIQLFPALRIFENSRGIRQRIFTEKGKTKNKNLRYALRFTVVGVVFLVAYLAQSFHLFLDLLGSCVFTLLGFGLPIWLYMTKFKEELTKRTRMINYGILAFILFFGALGVITSFKGLISGDDSR